MTNPLTGEVYPAGTRIPMTDFANRVLSELPAPTSAQDANNYSILQEFTNTTDKGNVKADMQVTDSLTAFGRYGYRDADLFDQPPIPLPSGGGGNATTYVTNKQFATGFTWARSGSSLLEARFGWSRTVAGKNPAALGTSSAFDEYGITGLPTDPGLRVVCRRKSSRPSPTWAGSPPTRSGNIRRFGIPRSTTHG